MKRKLLLSILAVVPALFLPLAAAGQLIHDRETTPVEKTAPAQKYEVFAGYGYTSTNNVNQSRHGLEGVEVSVTRDWGRYFGITVDGGFYEHSVGTPAISNSTLKPTIQTVLAGPVLHANLSKHIDGFMHVLLGAEHMGGVNSYPSVSFAGGFGVGMDYKLRSRFSLRISGDDIASSFVAPRFPPGSGNACTTTSNCSPHERRSSRAGVGVVYKF